MSARLEIMMRDQLSAGKRMVERLDKLEKDVNTLKRSVSHIERHPADDGSVVVPQTELPETLEKLEIGRSTQGT